MAVDIKTLRIGSHILVNGKRERVRGLYDDNGLIIRFPAEYVNANEVEPIKITPEILTEVGFKYHEYNNGKLWEWDLPDRYKCYGYLEFDEDTTTIWQGRLWYQKEYEVDLRVEYLHDLENIFYMFYGVELINENKND